MTRDQVKAVVRARDNHACTRCGMTARQHKATYGRDLEVHRRTPGTPYTVEGCVLLCRHCHGPEPKRRRGQPDAAYDGRILLAARPSKELSDALERFLRSLRLPVPMTRVVFTALEEFLEARGFWPPAQPTE